MSVLDRLYTFVPFSIIASAEVNAELNQIINLINGTNDTDQIVVGAVVPINDTAKMVLGGQLELQQSASGVIIRCFKQGDSNPRVEISNLGWIRGRAGSAGATPSDQLSYHNGCLYTRSAAVGNVGSGEDDLYSFIVGSNLFNVSGGSTTQLKIRKSGYTAANGNNKRIRFYCKTTPVVDTGVMTENNKPWFLEVDVAPATDAVSTVIISGIFRCGATEVRVCTRVTGYDFAVDNTWKTTAEAVATNDIVQELLRVDVGRGAN